ncbi:MAG: efflux RND transporter periplasmic adaptor subunit [Leptospiraceae bacterium]|nr:efflux RND transporter periplasmic adaptor subunit [Leptospiraceae bacterium]
MSEEIQEESPRKSLIQLNIYWLLVIIAFVIASFFIFQKIHSPKNKPENLPVENSNPNRIRISEDILKTYPLSFTKIREIGFHEDIILPGKVSFDLEKVATVGSRVPGRVNKVYVKEGDFVNKGSPLASISSVELGNAQANYLKAKAKLETLKVQYDRAKELFEEKIISAREYEAVKVEYKTVATELETNYNALIVFGLTPEEIKLLEEGKLPNSQMIIRSPLAGTVVERKAIQGQSVNTEENLFQVANLAKLWIMLDVYEKDLHSVELGAEATVFLLGNKSEPIKAHVAYVGEVIDPIKHTAEIRLEVDNRDFKLKPGQTVSAIVKGLISHDKMRKIMVLPAEAVHKIEGNSYIFIALPDGSFEAKKVEVGANIDNDIEIKTELDPELNIVSKGFFLLKSEYLK